MACDVHFVQVVHHEAGSDHSERVCVEGIACNSRCINVKGKSKAIFGNVFVDLKEFLWRNSHANRRKEFSEAGAQNE